MNFTKRTPSKKRVHNSLCFPSKHSNNYSTPCRCYCSASILVWALLGCALSTVLYANIKYYANLHAAHDDSVTNAQSSPSISRRPVYGIVRNPSNGQPGYINDETRFRLDPLPFTYSLAEEDRLDSTVLDTSSPICDFTWNTPTHPATEEDTFGYQHLGNAGYEIMSQKIKVWSLDNENDASVESSASGVAITAEKAEDKKNKATKSAPKILCTVRSTSSNHFQINAIRQTWG